MNETFEVISALRSDVADIAVISSHAARPLRRRIDQLSDLRHDLLRAEENHWRLSSPYDQIKLSPKGLPSEIPFMEGAIWAAVLTLVAAGDLRSAYPADAGLGSSLALAPFDPRLTDDGQIVDAAVFTGPLPRGPVDAATSNAILLLRYKGDVLPGDSRAGLLRVVDGILAVLCRLLAIVLTALARHLDAPALVLVLLAACLHYGHRAEPADRAFLPMRRNLTSMGSCPHM